MYVPPAFAVSDSERLFALLERESFALLCSGTGAGLRASHLPLLVERDTGPRGTLVGHMARANPQWRDLDGETVLAVFSGPHAYITPSWYEAAGVVPTWNYVAVHVYGTFRLVEEPSRLEEIVRRTVQLYERSRPVPWTLEGAGDVLNRLLPAIVGFRIEIERIEGKWKLSQNHPAERREKVAAGLAALPTDDAQALARLMREEP